MVERTADIRVLASELVKRMNQDERRIRILEQRMERGESTSESFEESFLTQIQELKDRLEKINSEIKNISDKLVAIESDLIKINKEIEKKVNKTELKEIEGYVNLMSPITTTFVTKEELERILSEKIGKKT